MRMLADAVAPIPLEMTMRRRALGAFRGRSPSPSSARIACAVFDTLPSATGASRAVSGGALHLP